MHPLQPSGRAGQGAGRNGCARTRPARLLGRGTVRSSRAPVSQPAGHACRGGAGWWLAPRLPQRSCRRLAHGQSACDPCGVLCALSLLLLNPLPPAATAPPVHQPAASASSASKHYPQCLLLPPTLLPTLSPPLCPRAHHGPRASCRTLRLPRRLLLLPSALASSGVSPSRMPLAVSSVLGSCASSRTRRRPGRLRALVHRAANTLSAQGLSSVFRSCPRRARPSRPVRSPPTTLPRAPRLTRGPTS